MQILKKDGRPCARLLTEPREHLEPLGSFAKSRNFVAWLPLSSALSTL